MNWDGVTPMPDHIGRMIDIRRRIVEGKGTMNDMMLAYTIFCSLLSQMVTYQFVIIEGVL